MSQAQQLQKQRQLKASEAKAMRLVGEHISGPHFPMSIPMLMRETGMAERDVRGGISWLRHLHGIRIAMEPVLVEGKSEYRYFVVDDASWAKIDELYAQDMRQKPLTRRGQ